MALKAISIVPKILLLNFRFLRGGGARCDEKKLQQPARRQNADRVVVKVLKPNVKTLNHQQMMVFIF